MVRICEGSDMEDFGINEMQDMQRALQERYKDIWRPICPERGKDQQLYERINARVLKMMEDGLEAEARTMLPYRDLPALQTVGYREMFEYFDGKYDMDTTIAHIQAATRHYAKRQLTWWRRDTGIKWIPAE